MLRKKGGELVDLDIKEVSFVDRPANQKKFLFAKDEAGIQKATTGIEIVTEGTQEVTISINGVEIKDLTGFYFSYQKPNEGEGSEEYYWPPIWAYYTSDTDEDTGFALTTKYLTKGEKMETAQLIELAKQYGVILTPEIIEKSDKATLEAWECIDGFPIPAPLAKAIGVIVKEIPVQEAPATVAAIPIAKDIADRVLLGLTKAEDPPADAGAPEATEGMKLILSTVEALGVRIGKMEKGDTEEPPAEVLPVEVKPDAAPAISAGEQAILDSLTVLTGRMEVVEKSAGIVKGLEDPVVKKTDEVDDYSSIDLGLQ